jgi:hypothetical protein
MRELRIGDRVQVAFLRRFTPFQKDQHFCCFTSHVSLQPNVRSSLYSRARPSLPDGVVKSAEV